MTSDEQRRYNDFYDAAHRKFYAECMGTGVLFPTVAMATEISRKATAEAKVRMRQTIPDGCDLVVLDTDAPSGWEQVCKPQS